MTSNTHKVGAPATAEQIVLLQALQVTQDPKKLRQMMGVKTVTEVYRTLDKLSIRKEYHEALQRAGFSLDKVVDGIKQIAETAEKDDTRLKAYQTILKSIGLDKYEAADNPTGGTWEEELLKSLENDKTKSELPSGPGELVPVDQGDYEVITPVVPDAVKKLRAEEEELTKSIYE